MKITTTHTNFITLACTTGGCTSSAATTATTPQTAPLVVKAPFLTPLSSTAIRAAWEEPYVANGDIKEYQLLVRIYFELTFLLIPINLRKYYTLIPWSSQCFRSTKFATCSGWPKGNLSWTWAVFHRERTHSKSTVFVFTARLHIRRVHRQPNSTGQARWSGPYWHGQTSVEVSIILRILYIAIWLCVVAQSNRRHVHRYPLEGASESQRKNSFLWSLQRRSFNWNFKRVALRRSSAFARNGITPDSCCLNFEAKSICDYRNIHTPWAPIMPRAAWRQSTLRLLRIPALRWDWKSRPLKHCPLRQLR